MVKNKSSKSGIALIVVLGLVAILMIVCVSFTINMRVERAGAANLRHAAVARQIVKGALATAIAEIDNDVGGSLVPQWYDPDDTNSLIYLRENRGSVTLSTNYWKDTFVSYDWLNSQPSDASRPKANFFTPEVARYFPSGYAYRGFATALGNDSVYQPEWVRVLAQVTEDGRYESDSYSYTEEDDNGNRKNRRIHSRGSIIGRYAFIAMNTSGLLDANCVNREDRWMGKSPKEIEVDNNLLPDEVLADKTDFKNRQIKNGGYDSFAEFYALNEDPGNGEAVIENCRSFNTFSYIPSSEMEEAETEDDLDNGKKVNIGCSINDLKGKRDKIIMAFQKCFPYSDGGDEQANWAYLGLIDYLDSDESMFTDNAVKLQETGLEPDNVLRPAYRPATERMHLMNGFIAKVELSREEELDSGNIREVDDGFGGKKKIGHKNAKFKMAMKMEVVYPWLFSGLDVPENERIEAQAKLNVGTLPAGVTLPAAVSKDTVVSETAAQMLVCEYNAEFTKVKADQVPEVNGNHKPFSVLGTLLVQAAGKTSVGGVIGHSYPVASNSTQDRYNNSDNWMTVPIDLENGFVVKKARSEQLNVYDEENPSEKLTIDTWETTNLVVWAEFFDPRFSCESMALTPGWDSTKQLGVYYRTSENNLGADVTKKPLTAQIGNLKSDRLFGNRYSDFTEASAAKKRDYVGEISNVNANETDITDVSYFCHYRSGQEVRLNGLSPLQVYELSRPDIMHGVFKINVDGCRVGGPAETEINVAARKARCFVKNGNPGYHDEELESVGELGYLPIGKWFTIRLYDYGNDSELPGFRNTEKDLKAFAKFNRLPCNDGRSSDEPAFHRVLDYFTVNPLAEGKVNINTDNRSVHAAVVNKAPIWWRVEREYLSEDSSFACISCSTDPQKNTALPIGERIIAVKKYLQDNPDGIPVLDGHTDRFENLSEIGYVFRESGGELRGNGANDCSQILTKVITRDRATGLGEFERENLISHICGLYTTRGQTYVIAVRGESYSPLFGKRESLVGGSVNAAKTAVAQIWRDTVPDESGKYPIVVQFFKIIDD